MTNENLEWKICEIENEIKACRSILKDNKTLAKEDIKWIKNDIRVMNDWVKDLRVCKVNVNSEDIKTRVKILEDVKDTCEVNLNEDDIEEELKKLYEYELKYIEKWLKEIKK